VGRRRGNPFRGGNLGGMGQAGEQAFGAKPLWRFGRNRRPRSRGGEAMQPQCS
jgi:hypothetical protein